VYFDIAFTSLHCLFYIITQRHKQYLTQWDFSNILDFSLSFNYKSYFGFFMM